MAAWCKVWQTSGAEMLLGRTIVWCPQSSCGPS